MKITGLHLLLTYQCTFECDHCFVWGSPRQTGTMDITMIRRILAQAQTLKDITWFYFEGGEPFLYYATLLAAVKECSSAGFRAGIVTNAFWATSRDDAFLNLEPFQGFVNNLTVSSDLFHYNEKISQQAKNAELAAQELGIPLGMITIERQERSSPESAPGQIETGESGVMYRGRAADRLAPFASLQPWDTFNACPHENLRDPGRVHIDPLGYIHLCQGVTIGNLLERPMDDIFSQYHPDEHPVVGPLLKAGPKELVEIYNLPHQLCYADACHLCYSARLALRQQLPGCLAPDQVYGVIG